MKYAQVNKRSNVLRVQVGFFTK